MLTALDEKLAKRLSDCLEGLISLQEFREWFVPVSWNIEESCNRKAIHLAYQIDGILAEASSAKWSEDELKEELANIALPFVHHSGLLSVKWKESDCARARTLESRSSLAGRTFEYQVSSKPDLAFQLVKMELWQSPHR